MRYEKAKIVYACCGEYIVPTNANKDKKIICPRCGEVLIKSQRYPKVVIVKA